MVNIPSYEDLLSRCLSKVPEEVYKEEGTLIYDALAPACFELAIMYLELENVLSLTYADTSTGEYLERRCAERGVIRKQATSSLRKGTFNLEIGIGSRFSIEDTTYKVVRHIEGFDYELICEQPGVIGNIYYGNLVSLDNIEGLASAVLSDILMPGEDIESDNDLRKRYFESIKNESFGGNISDYKSKTNELDGVGGVKVYPVWNGGGTVKLCIIGSDFSKPNELLIEDVQEKIDPVSSHGEGVGIAPIGHVVTVVGVTETTVNIESNFTLLESHSWEDVKPNIEKAVSDYFVELSSKWEDSEYVVVRTSHIETRVLDVEGVLDVQHTKLNGQPNNLILGADSIPKLGEVTKS